MNVYEKLAKARADQAALQIEVDKRRAQRRADQMKSADDWAKFFGGMIAVWVGIHVIGMVLLAWRVM